MQVLETWLRQELACAAAEWAPLRPSQVAQVGPGAGSESESGDFSSSDGSGDRAASHLRAVEWADVDACIFPISAPPAGACLQAMLAW